MGQLLTKTIFSPQNKPQTAKLGFPVLFKHFRANSLKTSHLSPKRDYLRKEYRYTQKVCFSKQV